LAEVLDEFRPLHAPDPPLAESVRVARRINAITPHLARLDGTTSARIEQFLDRLDAFDRLAEQHAVAPSDVQMATEIGPGIWFTIRELLIGAFAGPLAAWGRVNHWIPLRIARLLSLRLSRHPDEPAMNTIVAGLVLVLAFYTAQTLLVAWVVGWPIALVYAVSLPLSATWDFRYSDRVRRAVARVRTYLLFRRDRQLHARFLSDLDWLRTEVMRLNEIVDHALEQRSAVS
jgi:hypothetical protein